MNPFLREENEKPRDLFWTRRKVAIVSLIIAALGVTILATFTILRNRQGSPSVTVLDVFREKSEERSYNDPRTGGLRTNVTCENLIRLQNASDVTTSLQEIRVIVMYNDRTVEVSANDRLGSVVSADDLDFTAYFTGWQDGAAILEARSTTEIRVTLEIEASASEHNLVASDYSPPWPPNIPLSWSHQMWLNYEFVFPDAKSAVATPTLCLYLDIPG